MWSGTWIEFLEGIAWGDAHPGLDHEQDVH